MEKIAEEQFKKEMVFHLYGRFAPIQNIVEKNRKGNEKLKILDVGGRGNWMKKFFPEDDVFYLDPFLDSEDENFIKGDGCNMPLVDESFDWVVSTDVFEHIPKEKRKNFLEENLRVAKLGVVLVAPFYSPAVAQAEINANENYKMLHNGEDHIWLKEHIENGLPEMIEFENLLEEKAVSFQKLQNNRLFLWQLLLGMEFLIEENMSDELHSNHQKFNYFYNTEVFPFDNQDPSYRKIYFIKKSNELKDLEIAKSLIDDNLFLKTIKNAMDMMNKINIENKISIEIKTKEVLNEKQKTQANEREIEAGEEKVQHLKDEIIQKEKQLSSVVNSLRWKIPNFLYKKYKQIKNYFG
jgi:hypothetical protein